MDTEIIQKYKTGSSGEYTLVYDTEGRDDPFGDYPINTPTELSGEKEIILPGEVTLSATMDDQLSTILDTYGGGETESISAYINQTQLYGFSNPASEDDDEEEEGDEKEEEPVSNQYSP